MQKIKELLEGYGYEVQDFYSDKDQNKFRFSKDDTFVDIWYGKKGITLGIYHPETKRMSFERKVDIAKIERAISSI